MSYKNIPSFLLHCLKGKPGWSSLAINQIDVRKVVKMNVHKRLFKIFDTEMDATLTITYSEPKEYIYVNPVIGKRGGFTVSQGVDLTQLITKRYATLEDAENEVREITNLQNDYDRFQELEFERFQKSNHERVSGINYKARDLP